MAKETSDFIKAVRQLSYSLSRDEGGRGQNGSSEKAEKAEEEAARLHGERRDLSYSTCVTYVFHYYVLVLFFIKVLLRF